MWGLRQLSLELRAGEGVQDVGQALQRSSDVSVDRDCLVWYKSWVYSLKERKKKKTFLEKQRGVNDFTAIF